MITKIFGEPNLAWWAWACLLLWMGLCVRWVVCGWLVREGVKEGGGHAKDKHADPTRLQVKNLLLERELLSRIEAAVVLVRNGCVGYYEKTRWVTSY